eukprot:TRINITY_DN8633_c0_g1_i1.p1 TRINITY_DN8633_c0_g1~~TRINITY_DN8633_c0_g1_i1.p1  ORF type:complete len:226 (-),score=30.29 TRINITY_DN8633_c0_g1_i1:138-815(-)
MRCPDQFLSKEMSHQFIQATYQLTYQGKIFSTAILSVLMLGRRLSNKQWVSLLILASGIALVQTTSQTTQAPTPGTSGTSNPLVGLAAAGAGCLLSSTANVYFEKILKQSPVSVWARNIHLAVMGIAISWIGMSLNGDLEIVRNKGFFHGYTTVTWGTVVLGSLGGLLSAMVVKYADNIMKGFATSFAILLTCIISTLVLDFTVTYNLVAGGVIVNFSIYLYNNP